MELYKKLIAALLIAALALVLPAASINSLAGGPEIQVAKSADSVTGYYLPVGATLFATGEIQTAVDNAAAGSTIYLRAKRYYDNVDVYKDLNIIGRGMGYTIVDGQKLGSVFTIEQGVTATLSDITIKNGQAFSGGGVDNYGTLTLRRCELNGNTAYYGGGTYSGFGTSLTVDGCNFVKNHADISGGAVNTDGQSLTVRNSQFFFNSADEYGGAIVNWAATGAVTNSAFNGNTAASGGAIYTYEGATTTVDRCTFMSNRAVGSGVDSRGNLMGHGGAVYDRGTMAITNSAFTNNFASDVNGGGAIFKDATGTLTETGNYFASNSPSNISP